MGWDVMLGNRVIRMASFRGADGVRRGRTLDYVGTGEIANAERLLHPDLDVDLIARGYAGRDADGVRCYYTTHPVLQVPDGHGVDATADAYQAKQLAKRYYSYRQPCAQDPVRSRADDTIIFDETIYPGTPPTLAQWKAWWNAADAGGTPFSALAVELDDLFYEAYTPLGLIPQLSGSATVYTLQPGIAWYIDGPSEGSPKYYIALDATGTHINVYAGAESIPVLHPRRFRTQVPGSAEADILTLDPNPEVGEQEIWPWSACEQYSSTGGGCDHRLFNETDDTGGRSIDWWETTLAAGGNMAGSAVLDWFDDAYNAGKIATQHTGAGTYDNFGDGFYVTEVGGLNRRWFILNTGCDEPHLEVFRDDAATGATPCLRYGNVDFPATLYMKLPTQPIVKRSGNNPEGWQGVLWDFQDYRDDVALFDFGAYTGGWTQAQMIAELDVAGAVGVSQLSSWFTDGGESLAANDKKVVLTAGSAWRIDTTADVERFLIYLEDGTLKVFDATGAPLSLATIRADLDDGGTVGTGTPVADFFETYSITLDANAAIDVIEPGYFWRVRDVGATPEHRIRYVKYGFKDEIEGNEATLNVYWPQWRAPLTGADWLNYSGGKTHAQMIAYLNAAGIDGTAVGSGDVFDWLDEAYNQGYINNAPQSDWEYGVVDGAPDNSAWWIRAAPGADANAVGKPMYVIRNIGDRLEIHDRVGVFYEQLRLRMSNVIWHLASADGRFVYIPMRLTYQDDWGWHYRSQCITTKHTDDYDELTDMQEGFVYLRFAFCRGNEGAYPSTSYHHKLWVEARWQANLNIDIEEDPWSRARWDDRFYPEGCSNGETVNGNNDFGTILPRTPPDSPDRQIWEGIPVLRKNPEYDPTVHAAAYDEYDAASYRKWFRWWSTGHLLAVYQTPPEADTCDLPYNYLDPTNPLTWEFTLNRAESGRWPYAPLLPIFEPVEIMPTRLFPGLIDGNGDPVTPTETDPYLSGSSAHTFAHHEMVLDPWTTTDQDCPADQYPMLCYETVRRREDIDGQEAP